MTHIVLSTGTKNIIAKLKEETKDVYIIEYPVTIATTEVDGVANVYLSKYNPFDESTRYNINKATVESIAEIDRKVNKNKVMIEYYENQVDYLYDRVRLELNA